MTTAMDYYAFQGNSPAVGNSAGDEENFYEADFLSALVSAISFVGVASAQADALTTGLINPDGSKQTNGPYTVSHPGIGHYIIKLTNYTGSAICLFNVIGGPTYIRSAGFGSKTCDIAFGNKKDAATNVLFSFYAAPVS